MFASGFFSPDVSHFSCLPTESVNREDDGKVPPVRILGSLVARDRIARTVGTALADADGTADKPGAPDGARLGRADREGRALGSADGVAGAVDLDGAPLGAADGSAGGGGARPRSSVGRPPPSSSPRGCRDEAPLGGAEGAAEPAPRGRAPRAGGAPPPPPDASRRSSRARPTRTAVSAARRRRKSAAARESGRREEVAGGSTGERGGGGGAAAVARDRSSAVPVAAAASTAMARWPPANLVSMLKRKSENSDFLRLNEAISVNLPTNFSFGLSKRKPSYSTVLLLKSTARVPSTPHFFRFSRSGGEMKYFQRERKSAQCQD